jgi:hypothetical protein
MAIFSRRILQRLLDESSRFLHIGQTKKLVKELNAVCDTSQPKRNITLSWEWEVILLNVFGQIGKVAYEKKFRGLTRGDIYFESLVKTEQHFLVDVVTVSDKGLKEKNPVDSLSKHLSDIVRGRGLNPNRFHVEPEGEYYNSGRDGTKVRLCLPGRARFRETIFTKRFEEFLQAIIRDPQEARMYEVNRENIKLRIDYDPNRRFAGAGHIDYSVVFSRTQNVIYTQLECKRHQLVTTGYGGAIGIFLCDGDCSLLQESAIRKTSGSYTSNDIIRHFLSENHSISFVVTFVTEENEPKRALLRSGPRTFKISTRIYKGPDFTDTIGIGKLVEKAKAFFPHPERDACNAMHFLRGRKPEEGVSFLGGHQMSSDESASQIKISAREVLDLLAGKLSYAEFMKSHGFDQTENPFSLALNKGQLVDEVSIEKSDFQDDDWMVFKLKGPDPAISIFREPKC